MKKFWAIISILSLFIGFDCSGKEVKVSHVWARASAPGATTTTVYMTIENKSGAPDALTGAMAFIADSITFEKASTQGIEEVVGIVAEIPVGVDESKILLPHQTYLVLKGLQKPLMVGEDFPLKLTFAKQGLVETTVHVEPATAAMYDGS